MLNLFPRYSVRRRFFCAWALALSCAVGAAADSAGPPTVTSAGSASAVLGAAFSYQITATESPTSYGASGLPAGVTVDVGTGFISGAPLVAGISSVVIGASNAFGTGTHTLTLTVTQSGVVTGPPIITSVTTAFGTVGVPFSYQIHATQMPTIFSATGLPTGLSVDITTGVISGVPLIEGSSAVPLAATNSMGSGYQTLNIMVAGSSTPVGAPQITSALTIGGTVGTPLSYAIQATNAPTSFTASGLPSGLSLDTTTGLISGTPAAAGTTAVTLVASNSLGSDTETASVVIGTGGSGGGSIPPPSSSKASGSGSCGVGAGAAALAAMLFAMMHLRFVARGVVSETLSSRAKDVLK